jgi:hypothetical protein
MSEGRTGGDAPQGKRGRHNFFQHGFPPRLKSIGKRPRACRPAAG